jgi:hypothetical protein
VRLVADVLEGRSAQLDRIFVAVRLVMFVLMAGMSIFLGRMLVGRFTRRSISSPHGANDARHRHDRDRS